MSEIKCIRCGDTDYKELYESVLNVSARRIRDNDAELTALRKQVADLRAALIEAYDAVDAYAADTGVMLRVNRAVLAATQPQEGEKQ